MTSETEDLLGIYQYLINLPDEMLEPLLFRLTFLPEEEILAATRQQQANPEQNFAKKLLAREVISYITGSPLKYESISNYSLYFGLDFALLVACYVKHRSRNRAMSSRGSSRTCSTA